MCKRATLLVCSIVALFGCSHLGAQTPLSAPEEAAILEAVAEYVLDRVASQYSEVPEVDVIIDRAFYRGNVEGRGTTFPTALIAEIANRRGVRVGTLQDHLTCPSITPNPGHCRLEGADVVVTLGRPEVNGVSGTIAFKQFGRSSARMESPRAYRSSAVLKIEKVNGAWMVTGYESIGVSE